MTQGKHSIVSPAAPKIRMAFPHLHADPPISL